MSIQAVIVNGRDGKVVTLHVGDRRRRPRPRRGGPVPLVQEPAAGQEGRLRGSSSPRPPPTRSVTPATTSLGVQKDDPIVFVVDVVVGHQAARGGPGQGRGAEEGPADGHHERGQAGHDHRPQGRQGPDQDHRPAAHRGHRPRGEEGPDRAGGLHRRAPEGRQRLRLQRQPPRAALLRLPDRPGPGHQGLGQRTCRARTSAAACSSSSRRPRATAPPAARRRSPAPTPWSSSSTSSPRTDPHAANRSTRTPHRLLEVVR